MYLLCIQQVRVCSDNDITPRLMFDVSVNTQFNIVYELGAFWNDNLELISQCGDSLNSSWWSNVDMAAAGSDVNFEFASDYVLHSVSETSIGTMVLMVIAVAVMGLLRWYSVAMMRKALDELEKKETAVYGAV